MEVQPINRNIGPETIPFFPNFLGGGSKSIPPWKKGLEDQRDLTTLNVIDV